MTDVSNFPNVLAENWDWQIKGACRGSDPDTFYLPDNIRGQNKRSREAAAKSICQGCPVIKDCLQWAVSVQEPYGVWGGMTPEERNRIAQFDLIAV